MRVTASDPEAAKAIDPRVMEYLERVAPALPSRVPRSRWDDEPALRSINNIHNVLTVPITALDGRPSGLLQLAEKGAANSLTLTKRLPSTQPT